MLSRKEGAPLQIENYLGLAQENKGQAREETANGRPGLASKSYATARYFLERALKIQKTSRVYRLLAALEDEVGNTKKAHTLIMCALHHGNDDPISWNDYGVYALKLGLRKEALAHLQEAKRLMGKNVDATTLANLGFVYEKLGLPQEARTYFRAALALDEGYEPARLGLDRLASHSATNDPPLA